MVRCAQRCLHSEWVFPGQASYLVNQRSQQEQGRKKEKVAIFYKLEEDKNYFYSSFSQREFSMSETSCSERKSPTCPLILMPNHLTVLKEANNNNLHLLSTHCEQTKKHIIHVVCCDRHYYAVGDIAINHSIINLQIPENQRVLENQRDYSGNQSHQTNLISSNVRMTGLEDKAKAIDIKYTDFSKPLSSVPYDVLINMLWKYGVASAIVI